MRRALAIAAAALALAACRVEVEGAPCDRPGSGEQCPSGQACGNDGACSERAARCMAPDQRCTVSATRCGAAGTDVLETCSGAADPVCGTWLRRPCADEGLRCAQNGAAAFTCVCPPYAGGSEFAADPVRGSPVAEAPFATGSPEPAACRFRRLTDALAAAKAIDGPASVAAFAVADEEAVFGDAATGEEFPLDVPPNVTLRTAAGPGATLVVRAEGPASDLVTLQGTIEGFRVEAASAAGNGIAASCGPDGPAPRIVGVAIDGGGALATGIDVAAGTCGAYLREVSVTNAAGAALQVTGDPAGAPVEVYRSAFAASGSGIRVAAGRVVVGKDPPPPADPPAAPDEDAGPVDVTGNAAEGILLSGRTPGIDVRLVRVVASGNAGTGLVLEDASAGSSLSVSGCDVFANGAITPRPYGPGPTQRTVGGVLVHQDAFGPFVFEGNRVFGNAGDELAFWTVAAWSLAGRCGSTGQFSNTFACVGDAAHAVSVAGGGAVDATASAWPGSFWDDFVSPVAAAQGEPGVWSQFVCTGLRDTPRPPEACPGP